MAIESAIGLKQAGLRPILFASAGPVDPRLAEAGVETVCLGQHDLLGNPSRLAGLVQGTWNGRAATALGDLLASLPRDRTIVHMHGWAKALSPSLARPIRRSGLPAAYTIHEYFLFCPNGGFYNYQSNQICKLKPMSTACLASNCDARNYTRKLWRFGRLALARGPLRMPGAFSDYIGISAYQAEIVAPYLPPGVHVHRLSNPVDAVDLGPKANPNSGDFLFVGRLSPEKGAFVFAEAAERAGVTATFVGDGPIAEELRARFPSARLLGWKAPEAARQAIREARVLVFPSLWYEGQPLTVLEAKAMGTPVIVSDACAGREEIEDGVSGLWFRSADPKALAEAIRRLGDDQLVARMSRAVYDSYWRAPATLEAHTQGLLRIYADMMERAGKAL